MTFIHAPAPYLLGRKKLLLLYLFIITISTLFYLYKAIFMTKPKNHSSSESTAVQDATDSTDQAVKSESTTEPLTDSATSEQMADNEEADKLEDMACAEPPEAKITVESIAPDVVIASLENTEPDVQSPKDKSEETLLSEGETSDTSEVQDTSLQEQESEGPTNNQSATDTVDKSNGSESNDSELSDHEFTDSEPPTEDDEKEDEVVKEEKEAKLESYKKFVAEQFNNRKVDYPEVRVTIEANALPSRMYFVMNILSAIIASYGLVTNSAAVVIGAMLVAMMLGPITGVALAIIDHRMPLLRRSIITVLIGMSLVILVGFIVGWLHKDQSLTTEILSRTQPTSMDLMIALAGGTAGAYAMVSPHLSVAVVGVAVATALVPPLAASGILFANGEMQLGFGALLLAVTNIIAIQFTNALVLWILGFRRLTDEDYQSNTYLTFLQRNAITILLLGGLGTYLTINLQTNAKQQEFENNVKEAISSYFIDQGNVLTNTQFDTVDNNQIVRAVIRGETTPSSYDVQQIESGINQDMAKNFPKYLPVKLQLRYLPVQVIEADPLIQDKINETDAAILTN